MRDEPLDQIARLRRLLALRPLGPGSSGLAVKCLLVVCTVLLAVRAEAGQEWQLITVTRGAAWEVNEAKGVLKQNGNVLQGTLKDKTDGKADYQIRIVLNGAKAEATFRFVSETTKARV